MAATIRVGPWEATLEDYRWTSSEESLEDLLNSMLLTGGPSGADPDPDGNAAQAAADQLGGDVIARDPAPERVPGRIY